MNSIWNRNITALMLILALAGTAWAAPATRTFGSPEEAVQSLRAALKAKDQATLLAIFGPDFKRVQAHDAAERAAVHERLTRLFKEGWSLTTTQDQHRIIRMGYEGWSFPIPLVKKGSLWSFDTAAGMEELANRRVGRNELMAIDTFRQFYHAQELYKEQFGKYADKLVSSAGQKDGLYWPSTGPDDKSPLQKTIGDVAVLAAAHRKGTPWYGYYYSLRMHSDGGYSVVAWPVSYKSSGVMSFWSDQAGRLYEKDLGASAGSFLRSFDATANPQGWNLVGN
jgi:hypothetical protein